MLAGLWALPAALAKDTPEYGGILRVALAGDPPSLDMHQEQTFMVTIPMSTVYNTLVMFDPHDYIPLSLATWPKPGQSPTTA